MRHQIQIGFIAALCLVSAVLRATTGAGDYWFNEPSANGPVFAVATTADGHIWMGGYFNSVNGSAHASESYASAGDTYYCLAVLNTNGTLDADFTSANYNGLYTANGGPLFLGNYYVSAIAVDEGQDTAYVAFSPTYYAGTSKPFIARFDPVPGQPGHWTLNSTFTPNTLGHISGIIHSMAVGDGALYVAANVTDTNTTPTYNSTLGKFSTGGVLDNSYALNSGWGANDSYNAIFQVRYYPPGAAIGPGGPVNWPSTLLVSGIPGVGTPDLAPSPPLHGVAISCAAMRSGAEQFICPAGDGILAGGASVPYQRNPPGTSWTGFEMHRFGGTLQTPAISVSTNYPADNGSELSYIEALPDGDSLVAGLFTRIHGYYVNNFAHLLPDGTVDSTFANSTDFGWVFDMAQQPNGQYLLCGEGTYTAAIFGGVWGWVERRELLPTNNVTFVSQPAPTNQIVYAGDSAGFYAGVSSWPGMLAQWRHAGTNLIGQTSASLYLNNVTTNDAGQYSLFVQNQALCPVSAVSSYATLTVLPAPPAPANDAFADAIALNGPFATGTGTIRSATFEAGETDPSEYGYYAGRSVWWTWTAPFSGPAYVDVSGCDFPAAIGVFTGNDVGSLTVVTNNYDYGINCECADLLTNFSFNVTAGTTYRIAIGGAPNAGSLGDIIFSIGQQFVPWLKKISSTTNALHGVTAGNHRIAAVGDNNTIVTSAGGTSWSADSVTAASSYLNGAAYANGMFVATGDNGAILTSTDGLNWTQQNSGTTNALWGACHGNGLFVAAGDGGIIVTSPDGVNWTEQTNGAADWFDGVAWNNGRFVAVGAYGEICTSTDGTNWTGQYSGVSDELRGVTAGSGQFVAVGDYGDIVTSFDGTNWTWQDSGLGGNGFLYSVSYGNGGFVAVGDGGTLLLSRGGTNWVSDDSGVANTLYGVSYFENGSFVIVGDDGVILFNEPPRLGVLGGVTGSQITFNLAGLNGATAIIEATPTLSPDDWQPVATNVISHGVVIFSDAATNRSLFYRARVQ